MFSLCVDMINWQLVKMHHTVHDNLSFTVAFVHLLPLLIITACSNGYPLNHGDEKIVFVDLSYYDHIVVGINFSNNSEDNRFGSGETDSCICSRSTVHSLLTSICSLDSACSNQHHYKILSQAITIC